MTNIYELRFKLVLHSSPDTAFRDYHVSKPEKNGSVVRDFCPSYSDDDSSTYNEVIANLECCGISVLSGQETILQLQYM